MRKLTALLLVLAAVAGATELYWDDGVEGGATDDELMGVSFGEEYGSPGDTGGLPGTITAFRVAVSNFQSADPPLVYIYSVRQCKPDELLEGPLVGSWTQDYWSTFTPDEPVDVPSAFFVILGNISAPSYLLDDGTGPDYPPDSHSYYCSSGSWYDRVRDYMLRIEWTPDTAVEELSWGAIKADRP